jgi:hypothetical protein
MEGCSKDINITHPRQAGSSNIRVRPEIHYGGISRGLEIWVAWWVVQTMVFQSVQILVSFATDLTAVRLFLFHAYGAWVWY